MAMFANRSGGIDFPRLEPTNIPALPMPTPVPAAYSPRRGGALIDLLGGVSDGILAVNGMAPVYGPAQDRRRAQQDQVRLEEARYQRERADKTTDWQAQQQWKIDHPEAVNNDTVNDYNFILQTRGKDAADRYLDNLSDPFVNTTLPGDRFYSGPRSGLSAAVGAAGNTVPAAPVGKLTPITGGAAPQAGRPFPLRPLTR